MKIKYLAVTFLAALAAVELATAAEPDTNAPTTNSPSTNVAIVTAGQSITNAADIAESSDTADVTPTNAVRLNFHDVPLNTVLNYLSKRMGFVVVAETEVRGNATMVSEQPIGTNEVIGLLSGALAKNNYSVTRSGRVLTITTADAAKNGAETPVIQATSPDQIPINDQIATYILPVQTLNPTQLIKDLDALIPTGATVAANESGNAIVMTARQKDIHRFSEIIHALDSSSVATVGVYLLKYADAKSVADELKEIFQSPDSSVARSDSRQRFRGMGFPGFGGGGEGGGGSSGGETKNAANKAVFVSDDQMNALIASAPADYFVMITNVIAELDKPSQDVTVISVFRLKYADAQETADLLANLFPDESTANNNQNNRSFGFRMFTPPWMQQPSSPSANKSERMTRQATVRAVPDLRTASVVVTTSPDLMREVSNVIMTLDSNPAMVQHVYAFELKNADPVTVQAALSALFSANKTSQQQSTSTSALQQRQTTTSQQQTQSTTGFGSSSTGSSGVH